MGQFLPQYLYLPEEAKFQKGQMERKQKKEAKEAKEANKPDKIIFSILAPFAQKHPQY